MMRLMAQGDDDATDVAKFREHQFARVGDIVGIADAENFAAAVKVSDGCRVFGSSCCPGGRTPFVTQLDLHVGYEQKLGRDVRLSLFGRREIEVPEQFLEILRIPAAEGGEVLPVACVGSCRSDGETDQVCRALVGEPGEIDPPDMDEQPQGFQPSPEKSGQGGPRKEDQQYPRPGGPPASGPSRIRASSPPRR